MKFVRAFLKSIQKRDNAPLERFDQNRVRAGIEKNCEKYLKNSSDIFVFEALPSALDATLAVLETTQFQEKYEFYQKSETIFEVRLKEFNIF